VQPIGVFDSGIGGLTVAHAIVERLPSESLIYYGDTAHLPYGDKSPAAIRQYSVGIVHFLLEKGCKLIVVACNTASSAAFETLNDYFRGRVHLITVVDPLVRAVAAQNYRKVGVIATKATIQSGIYEQQLRALQPDLEVVSLATPLLVPMIEEGFIHHRISTDVIESYLGRPEFEGIEALLLACTHYPLIRPEIEAFFGGRVAVYDSTQVTARSVHETLSRHGLLASGARSEAHRFYVSDYTPSFEDTTKLFYGAEVHLEHLNIWA
jgi:glutamate racemase